LKKLCMGFCDFERLSSPCTVVLCEGGVLIRSDITQLLL
jgi:hypothetical protein